MGRRTWIPGILVLALTLSGCGMLGFQGDVSARDVSQTESRAEQNTTEDREQNTQDAEAQAQQDASAEQAGSATPGVADTSKAIIKATFDAPFAPNGKVDVAIHSFKRRGKLVDLVFSLTPRLPEGQEHHEKQLSPFDILGDQSFTVTLIDTVNMKRHVVVKDSRGKELKPDDVWTETHLGQPMVLTYTFAAPPENVTKMDVHIANWAPFTDVPLES